MSITNSQTLRQLGCELWWPGEKATANSPKAITAAGNAKQILPFPGAGIGMFDGVGDYLNAGTTSDVYFTNDFTIELWYYPLEFGTNRPICGRRYATYAEGWTATRESNNKFTFSCLIGGSWAGPLISTTNIYTTQQWYHIAIVRLGSSFAIYVNGILDGSVTNAGSIQQCLQPVGIGTDASSGLEHVTFAYFSEFRISSIARYTANFTPPRYQHTTDANTMLLLHFDRNDTTFIDSSIVPKSITAYGDAKHLTPFPGAGVGVFDGSGDYLSCSDLNAYNYGSSDFTFEGWIYNTTAFGEYQILYGYAEASGTSGPISFGITPARKVEVYIRNTSGTGIVSITSNGTITLNAWHHLAAVRHGSTFTLYINGVADGTGSSSEAVYCNSSRPLAIGRMGGATNSYFYGYFSEFRISTVARYHAPFTPPRHRLSPDHNTKLLIHFDSNGTTFTDVSPTPKTITRYGDAKCVMSPVGSGVAVFDGSGDYLNVVNSTDLNLGANNFTISVWVRPTAITMYGLIFGDQDGSGGDVRASYGLQVYATTGVARFFASNVAGTFIDMMGTTNLNGSYHHIEVTRSGSIWRLFIDGIQEATATSNDTIKNHNTSARWLIGALADSSGTMANYYAGYISELVIINGIALHTNTFAVPTAPFVEDDNTVLLLHFDGQTNVFKDASAVHKTVTAYGDVKQLCSPVGSGVMYLDGNGDRISIPSNVDFANSGNYTFSYWAYVISFPGAYSVIWSSPTGYAWSSVIAPNRISIGQSLVVEGNLFYTTIPTRQWIHICISRSGSTTYGFLNGNLIGTAYDAYSYPQGAVHIGTDGDGGSLPFHGYISDMQFSKGVCRYTENFTPPTTPFKPDIYTKLLLHFDGVGQSFADYSDPPGDNGFPILPDGVTVTPAGTFTSQKLKNGSNVLKFDGSTNYIRIGSTMQFERSNPLTISFWFKHGAVSSNPRNIVANLNPDSNYQGFAFTVLGSTCEFQLINTYPTNLLDVTFTHADSTDWHHFAIVYTGSSLVSGVSIYVDGILKPLTTVYNTLTASIIPTTNFSIGSMNGNIGTNACNGNIKDLMIFKGRALSVDQIGALMDETFIY